jgi:hypothetical protein
MKRLLLLLGGLLVLSVPAWADGPLAGCPIVPETAPFGLSPLARPGQTSHYAGGYVGGGSLLRGSGRASDEGIFGWDYVGPQRFAHRLFLGWSHGRKVPAGGSYKTDGPEVLDVFSLRPLRHIHPHSGVDE